VAKKDDMLITDDDAAERLEVVATKLSELIDRALELLPLLGAALVVVVLSWVAATLLTKSDVFFRWIDNRFVRDLVRQLFRVGVIAVGFLIALELLDATALVGATLGAAGVVGIAVGFAFKDLVENYIAGLLLSMRQPFSPNDHVTVDGHEGKVVRLTSRATVLLTLDGNHLRIPNAAVFKAVILNYSRNPLRRFDFKVGVGVEEDLVAAQDLGCSILCGMDAVLREPEPFALVTELGDSAVNLHFFGWVDQSKADFFKAKSAAIRLVKTAFDDAKIEMPEPIYRVITQAGVVSEPPKRTSEKAEREEREEGDTSVDEHLDSQVDAERAAEGPDLLEEDGLHE